MTAGISEEDWERIRKGGFDAQNPLEAAAAYGLFKGGEEILQHQLGNTLLNADLQDVIASGLSSLQHKRKDLLPAGEAAARIEEALQVGKGFSLIRFGDGELLTLAQGTVLGVEEVQKAAPWLPYSGVVVPDLNARDQLGAAFLRSDLVGVPTSRFMTYGTLFLKLAAHYGWSIETMPLTSSLVNYEIFQQTDLYQKIFRRHRVLLLGRQAAELQAVLERQGVAAIVGHIPVDGMASVEGALAAAERFEFDAALVAAGIPACPICLRLRDRGKVAIDFGHLADALVNQTVKLDL